jgi:hypothetical protein
MDGQSQRNSNQPGFVCPRSLQRIRAVSCRNTKKPEHRFRLHGSFVVSWSLESNRDRFAGIRWAAGNLLHPLHLLLLFAG